MFFPSTLGGCSSFCLELALFVDSVSLLLFNNSLSCFSASLFSGVAKLLTDKLFELFCALLKLFSLFVFVFVFVSF